MTGDTVSGNWSPPRILSTLGNDGMAGRDGAGYEHIYRIVSPRNYFDTSPNAANVLPLNSWGFDSPARGWVDDPPVVANPAHYVFISSRAIKGVPAVGAATNADGTAFGPWSTPAVFKEVRGTDGRPGVDGEDGVSGGSIEWIFRGTSTETKPTTPTTTATQDTTDDHVPSGWTDDPVSYTHLTLPTKRIV